MKSVINKQIELIGQSIKWIENSLDGEKREKGYKTLVNLRRRLKKMRFSTDSKSAVAVYGESQVGKSYLIGSLLSKKGMPFTVVDGNDQKYDFINRINPIGKGTESTSLVTRFSTAYQWINKNYPVKVQMLLPKDLVLVLCDSYYSDIKAKMELAIKAEDVDSIVRQLNDRYAKASVCNKNITEDDIYDIKDYFYDNFSIKAINIIHSTYFDTIASIVERIPYTEWNEVFSVLWNKNDIVTNLFNKLIEHYAKLEFSEEVYVPVDAVLRDKGTLLDVNRLHEIYDKYMGSEPDFTPKTPIMFVKDGSEVLVEGFSKSYLCALSAELVMRLPKELEEVKPFLKNSDLLDFPGARHRKGIHEEDIDNNVMPELLLRGKVAYLFNKYSATERINILLLCHNNKQSAQSVMPEMLNKWINDMIGRTPEERMKFIEKSEVSPLFIVSTFFNLDLQFDFNNDNAENRSYKDNRWERRFVKVLEKEILGLETYKWMEEWTTSQKYFQNIYLLRDYYYSSDTESNLFKGYNETKNEIEEIVPSSYPEFRKDLKQSFIEYDFVKKHFADPERSWDEASSINKDGSDWVLQNLEHAANNINQAKTMKMEAELDDIKKKLIEELNKYYDSPDSKNKIEKAKKVSGRIQRDLDIAFGLNPYFFGQMMKAFMIDEGAVYNLYHDKILDIERRSVVNMDKYSAIRMNVPELNPKESFDYNLDKLSIHYEYNSVDQCREDFESDGIDLQELFYGNCQRIKSFSVVLAETLSDYWITQWIPENSSVINTYLTNTEDLQDILEMFKTMFKKLNITNIIAEKIRRYVDVYSNFDANYEMISDMSAEIINRMINTVGFDYFSPEDIADLEAANIENNLGLVLDHSYLNNNTCEKAHIANLISKIDNLAEILNQNPLPDEAKQLPNYRNYIIWYDLLKVGFISVCDIPNYNIENNTRLGELIEKCTSLTLNN